jgi:hypothetical protein
MNDTPEICRLIEVKTMDQISSLFGNLDENADVISEETVRPSARRPASPSAGKCKVELASVESRSCSPCSPR